MFQVLILSLVMGYAVGQSMDGGNVTSLPENITTDMPVANSTFMPENITTDMPVANTTSMPENITTDMPGPCNQTSDCPQDHCCYFMFRHRNRDERHPHFGRGHKYGHRSENKKFVNGGVCRRYQESGQPCPMGCGCAPGLECVWPDMPWNFRPFNFLRRFGRRRGTCRSE